MPGSIVGAVGYDSWAKNSVAVHLAIDSPLAMRCFVQREAPAFYYPFIHCKIGVLFGTVRSDNPRALKLDLHLAPAKWRASKTPLSQGWTSSFSKCGARIAAG